MCGITGYIGNEEAAPILIRSLKKLEYRGYDSAGIAVLDNNKITLRKTKGQIKFLEEALKGEHIGGTLGVGHTRWATHGEPSDINSHPHTDTFGRIAIVHNGIIENYARIKKWLLSQNVVFQSDTDTEVIAHLINYYYKKGTPDSFFNAVHKTLQRLEGSYALGIICADYPDRIAAVRKDSPLVIGLGKNENLIASDVPALLSYTKDVYFLQDSEIAFLYRDHVELFSETGDPVQFESTHIEWDIDAAEKGGYAHFMLKEIHEQPKALSDTLRPRIKQTDGAYEIDFDEIQLDKSWADSERIVIVACGTAYHAGVVGKYAFEHFTRIPVEVDIASEYRYRNPVFKKGDLFIVISQSGETADTLAAMRLAKKNGARVLAITNAVGSTLARESDLVLYTRAGPEIAVASTKAFTTQLMCIYLLALKLGKLRSSILQKDYQKYIAALLKLPDDVKTILAKEDVVKRFASMQFNKSKVFFIGRQFDYAISLESALKLKEISYTHSESFAAGELKHGAIALVDSDTLLVTLATTEELFDKIVSNIREVSSRGADNLVLTYEGVTAFNDVSKEVWTIPRTEPCFAPVSSVISMQLFSYYCAVLRGNDPDKPRNLAKSVTVE
ncbi:MAG: glutamine--fructose-6-phosphate transaminase (isomerizing) [Spirochaetaceae bacterium]|jgi:glucosamine--fructose-6-phosphate aminotransferase (isomerizing)|nr:glutamine--fructose-6-phosphate transaminase (isomerizing) [Spirochaetaceae bacterium]